MATFPEALGEALGKRYKVPEGIRRPGTHRQGLTARIRQLEKLHGGSAPAAAASAGIPIRTWRDWKNGTHPPSPRGLRRLEGAYTRQILVPAAAKALAAVKPPKEIHVKATIVVDPGKGRSNYINRTPFRWFRAEKIDTQRVITGWLTAGSEGAAGAYEGAVYSQYRSQFAFEGNNVEVSITDD